jgi:hypothetical protein
VTGVLPVLEDLLLVGSGGHDDFHLFGVLDGVDVTVEGLGGDDEVLLGEEADLDTILTTTLTINGGDGADTIHLLDNANAAGAVQTFLDGVYIRDLELLVNYSGVESVVLDAGAGVDEVYVRGTAASENLFLHGGGNDDTFLIDSNSTAPDGTVDDVNSLVSVNGGAGVNVLTLTDTSDGTSDVVTVTSDSIGAASGDSFFGTGGSAAYADFSTLTLNLGRAADTVKVKSTAQGTDTTINGSGGADAFLVSAPAEQFPGGTAPRGGTADGIASHVTLNGDAGDDTLVVDDSTDTTGDTATLDAFTVGSAPGDSLFGAGGSLNYNSMVSLRLSAGLGHDTVRVPETGAATAVTVNAGGGDDHVVVDSSPSSPGGTVNLVRSALIVNGQAGADTLLLEDSSDPDFDSFRITASQVSPPGDNFFGAGGSLTYGSLVTLDVRAGTAGDLISLTSTATGTATLVRAGGGNDILWVDSNGLSAGGTVDSVLSAVTADGGAGSNMITLVDSSDVGGDVITLTPTLVGAGAGDSFFGPGGSLAYGSFSMLALAAGLGNDQVKLQASGANTTLMLGDGSDTVTVDSNGASPGGDANGVHHMLNVMGGGGTNHLTVDDSTDSAANTVTVSSALVGASPGDSFFGAGGWLMYSSLSAVTLNGGTGGNTFNVQGTAAGTATNLNTGNGPDRVFIDSNGPGTAGGSVNGVVSPLKVNTQGGSLNTLHLEDSSDATADNVHFAAMSSNEGVINYAAGNNFFGAGGTLIYQGVTSASANFGSGADAVNFAPNPGASGTRWTLDGNSPASAPGDVLNLNLGGVGFPVHTATSSGLHTLSSSTHAPVRWFDFETVTGAPPLVV